MPTLPGALPLHVLDPPTASAADWTALHRFVTAIEAEIDPGGEPPTLQLVQGRLLYPNPTDEPRTWVVRDACGQDIVASGRMETWNTDDNRHLAWFQLAVLPAYRRQGLARRLLAPIAAEVRARGRRLLTTMAHDSAPAGAAFLTRLGAKLGQEGRSSQLLLADLDRDLLRRWQDEGRARAPGFTLGVWDGRYPEDQLAAIAELYGATNLAPRGDLDEEDVVYTPQLLREGDDSREQRGVIRWSLYARETATGALAGFTEVYMYPATPSLIWQGWTAVWPAYRNRGLGHWLKAAMLDKLLRDWPQATRVRTDNASSNAPMLKINVALGFQPYRVDQSWQVPLDQVDAYLAARAPAGAAG
jgi:mycothiol synthase